MVNLSTETYETLCEEMNPLITRALKNEGVRVHRFKLIDREYGYLRILAIDNQSQLWELTYAFKDGTWVTNPIRNAAIIKEVRMLRNEFNTVLQLSEEEKIAGANRVFEDAKTFNEK